MKQLCIAFVIFFSLAATAQGRNDAAVLGQNRLLHTAVFETKDSLTVASLFSEKLSYGHSGGKIESKAAAIQGIIHNASTYFELSMGGTSLWMEGNTAITRHSMTANEKKADGTVHPLHLHIVCTWVKEGKTWKLLSRQAVKLGV